jgi:cytochrome d ubiquinol oxidase subunit II
VTGLELSLPLVWAAIIGFAVAMYVVLDGFVLGLGTLFPLFPREADRDQMMNTVAPFWDANQTWLVLGGGALWIAFPVAFAVLMPAVYVPVIAMLLALIFRGVAFEYRWVAKPRHGAWDRAFAGGSIVATLSQGFVLGGYLQGITIRNGEFAGYALDWLTPFTLLCGIGLLSGYGLLGATWLVMKTRGEVERRARTLAQWLLLATIVFVGLVSIWTPLAVPHVADRWFTMPNLLYLSPVPLATAAVMLGCWFGLVKQKRTQPFVCAVLLFLLAYAGLVVSNVPYIVPPSLTIYDAAAHRNAQVFVLVGVAILMPIVLAYTIFNYWVFRGRVEEGEGYH